MTISHPSTFKNCKDISCNSLPRLSPISIPTLKLQWKGIKTGTSKSWNQLNSREEYEYYSSVNVENNFHGNKFHWPVSAVLHFSFFFETEVKLYQNCPFQFLYWNCIRTILKLKHQKIEIYGKIKFIYFKLIDKYIKN